MKNPDDEESISPFRYIILYRDIKEDEGNEIDFFLYIKDKTKRENVVNYILENGLWTFFVKIKYNYKEDHKNFGDGYIVRSCSKERIEKYLKKIKQKNTQPQAPLNKPQMVPLNNAINLNENNFSDNFAHNPGVNPMANISSIPQNNLGQKKIEKYATTITKNNYDNQNSDSLLNASILFLFSIEELKKYFGENKIIDFQSFRTIITTKTGQNITTMKTYDKIFSELLTKIDPNNSINKDYYNQTQQYDEEKGQKIFIEKHLKGNIIQKMFLIPKEEKILCYKCSMNTFLFDYSQFIIIKDSRMNLLNQTLFKKQIESKEGKFCNFCNGQFTKLTIERKYLSLPEWLIVIVEPTQINNLMIDSFLIINNGNNIVYTLFKFIEANTNFLYSINMNNTQFCNKYDGKSIHGNELKSNKKPAVLFYYLSKSFNNMNLQNNIQNTSNQNNNFINNAQANLQQINKANKINVLTMRSQKIRVNVDNNMNQQNAYRQQNNNYKMQQQKMNQNFNQQNANVQNMNQINMVPSNNGQNFIQPNMNMNMNQGFNNNNFGFNNNSSPNINNNFSNGANNAFNQMNNMQMNNMNMNNMNNGMMNNNEDRINTNINQNNSMAFGNNMNNNLNNNNYINNEVGINNNMNDMPNNNMMNINVLNNNMINNNNKLNNNNVINNNNMNFNQNFGNNNNLGMNNQNMNRMNNNMNLMNNRNIQGNMPINELDIFDKIIVIQFISTDQNIQRGIKCLPTHKFAEIEEKLYQIYPEYRKTNNHFLTEGRVVMRFQTIAENNIKDGQIVQLIKED